MRIMSRHPTVPGCCWDNRQATPRSQPTPRSPSAREAQILERVANCPKNLVSNSFDDWSAVVCEIGWPCPISVGWIGGCHLPVNKTSQITFLINKTQFEPSHYRDQRNVSSVMPRLMEMTFYCKAKWHNHWRHLENVWWPCGTKDLWNESTFGVLWTEMPMIVSFSKAQIMTYSCVPCPIHLSGRTPTSSSGLASEGRVCDIGSSADSVPWAASSGFLTTWAGRSQTGWVRLRIPLEQSEMGFLWSDVEHPQGKMHCLSLSCALLGHWDGQNRNRDWGLGSGNSELSRK